MKLFLLVTGLTLVLGANLRVSKRDLLLENREDGSLNLGILQGEDTILTGHLGRLTKNVEGITFETSLEEHADVNGWKLTVYWDGPASAEFEDCYSFDNKNWYGGPELKEQYWPIEKSNVEAFSMISKEDDNGAISERYWLNSAGQYFYVHAEVPLFVDHHNSLDNHICFRASVEDPYSQKRTHNNLKYDVWFFANAKVAHMHAVQTYLGKPSGIPDEKMIAEPIWSTWARYSRGITSEILWRFANEIIEYNFPSAQFEIDDRWETCYGSLEINATKLPDFAAFVGDLKGLGHRVTIWVHPFINSDCNPWYDEALSKGYFVLNEDGSPDTYWWNSNGTAAGYIDFTNSEAADWWANRVRNLITTYDIDSVKFDAGESSFTPQIPVQTGDIDLHPGHVVEAYVRKVAEFGPMIEVRSGMRTQDLPVFVRMVDKDTYWGFNNGLKTLVTTLLQMNFNGYTLVLPDMVGGNGYNEAPSKELFIRWLQANVFMPSIQYSFVPWDHDTETIEICKKFTELHERFAPLIIEAMKNSVQHGYPVNAPIWWLDPEDTEALPIWDEYLLGEQVLVAPILDEGAVSRDIYLPKGIWVDANGETFEGQQWLRDYAAPLEVLPYFLRTDNYETLSAEIQPLFVIRY